ncbi:MAG TPA: thioredoxin domain-containing protein, partial [Candidatus Saccharibacteria bacterium]|nr:thioredoxin domain-containing protein [Candidatus Saccharibacteria bacterium]
MSKTTWIIFIAIVALVFGGLIFYSQSQKNALNVDDVNAHSVLAASEQSGNIGDRVFGNAESKVVLVEYGDFQCPSCAGAHPIVKTVLEDY